MALAADAKEKATAILGMKIKDLTVEKVLVTVAADIGTEAYVGIIVDRATKKPVFMVSPAGGIDIEEVAATTPLAAEAVRQLKARGYEPRRVLEADDRLRQVIEALSRGARRATFIESDRAALAALPSRSGDLVVRQSLLGKPNSPWASETHNERHSSWARRRPTIAPNTSCDGARGIGGVGGGAQGGRR